jgi:peptidoglycan hydrolase-like protein with peptidoglycan-binding domain
MTVGSVLTTVVWGGRSAAPAPRPPVVSTARIVRTTLSTSVVTEGTLGYAPTQPVVNRTAGTYTALPPMGSTIAPGGTLYRVDDKPVVLMSGATPAWRDLGPGISDGPDVTELDANLSAQGFGAGLGAPGPHFGAATEGAVKRWQPAHGYPSTGVLVLGQVVFLPGRVLVGAPNVVLGQPAAPGEQPYAVSAPDRTVSVPLSPNLPSVTVGEAVAIVLPSNVTVAGTVSAVGVPGPVSGSGSNPSGASGGGGSGSGGSGGGSGAQSGPAITVVPDHPEETGTQSGVAVEVSLTAALARDVLATPISALLALAGGGYGVEVVDGGVHHLVGVTTGMFTGSQVAVSGAGINAGTTVVVAQ